jgi:formylglycine-generating enzyme required for sulfatase activity
VRGGSACVCLALSGQHAVACDGLRCDVEADQCRFFDEDSSAPVGARTFVLGEGADTDVTAATWDTSLDETLETRDLNFGSAPTVTVASEPAHTGLLRFDLGALPRVSQIRRATLTLTPCAETSCQAAGPIGVFAVTEPWDEGQGDAAGAADCASWNCRIDGVAWTVPGCGFLGEENRSREGVAVAQANPTAPGAATTWDVTALVSRWVADPTTNLGLALVAAEDGAADFVSREGSAAARPSLTIEVVLPDAAPAPDAGVDGGSDAGEDASVGPEMIDIPAGSFLMGCDPASGEACEDDERPIHAVSLGAYQLDRTEVTQAAWSACVQDGSCPVPSCNWDPVTLATHPVTCVTWTEARAYCQFVGKRLPTEAEWEKAARGPDGRTYPWGNEPPTCARANYFGCAGATQPVGIHPAGASPYGLLDMSGNASEFVADFYGANYYAGSPSTDPTGPANGTNRVRRGGAHTGGLTSLPTFERTSVSPTRALPQGGLRCAK